jgi:hypothetical protein
MTVDDLLEKVIKGLECCMSEKICNSPCPYKGQCDDGGYYFSKAIEDAIDLLKAQEPRVLTISELWHMEHKPVYLERKNSRLYMTEPSIVLKTERCYIPSLGESYILMRENKIHDKYWACDYNKTWRCWTSRPTDEQREAVKWE